MKTITVNVKSRFEAVKTAGLTDKTAVISIREATLARPEFEESVNLVDVLLLTFSDVEDGPDCMNGFHAVAVRQFLEKNLPVIDRLIIHCTWGMHRSVAIAAAILKVLAEDDTLLHDEERVPNPLCFRLMCEELEKVKGEEPFCSMGVRLEEAP